MKRVFLFVAILFIALAGKVNAQTPATLPYSCNFNDATERSNWTLINTSDNMRAKWFFQYEPHEEDYFLSCGDGSDWIYQPEDSPVTVYASRQIDFGYADSIRISFTYRVEGEGSHDDGRAYDYITALFTGTDYELQAKESVDEYVLGSSDEYRSSMIFNHADGIPTTDIDKVNACKLFMKNGTFTTTIKNPFVGQTKCLVFVWTNDNDGTSSSNHRAGWIDDISITPIGIDYGISVAGVKVTAANCNNITGEDIEGKVSYNPETNTLTLDNATVKGSISFGYGESRLENITITLVGHNTITTFIGSVRGTKTINGTGSLKVVLDIDCVYEENTIIEDCTIDIKNTSNNGALLSGNGDGSKLTIKNANISAEARLCAIGDFKDIELIGCEIVEPVNAQIIDNEVEVSGHKFAGKYICDADGNIAKKVVIKKLSGLNDIAQSNSITIYPNPAKDKITIKGKGEVVITNSLGQVVKEIKDNNTYRTLNIKDFESGVYYIKVGESTQKLVVE